MLGLREGATETAAVTTGLLSDLVTRGLPTDRTLLFVVDGAQGLRRAITDVFGSRGVVQRCQVHKCRNVLGHLPERLHASVGKALRDAWNLDSADRAARVLERLAGSLERDHPGAAASIREGLEETLTVQRLGLTGALERTLRTTNIIENLNGSVERYTRNVKRWRGGQMIQRWVASALVEAEPGDHAPVGGLLSAVFRKASSRLPHTRMPMPAAPALVPDRGVYVRFLRHLGSFSNSHFRIGLRHSKQAARQLSPIAGTVSVRADAGHPTLRGAKRCTQNARTRMAQDVAENANLNAAGNSLQFAAPAGTRILAA